MQQQCAAHLAAPRGSDDAAAHELLTFTLGEEQYAIDILKVQEIRGYDTVTRIAGAPAFMKGVVNLRGAIVPIVDLRIKFGVGEAVYSPFTVVIVLKLDARIVGIVVDSVSDVVVLPRDAVRPPPEFSTQVGVQHIVGLGMVGDHMLIVLDIERLMLSPDMALID